MADRNYSHREDGTEVEDLTVGLGQDRKSQQEESKSKKVHQFNLDVKAIKKEKEKKTNESIIQYLSNNYNEYQIQFEYRGKFEQSKMVNLLKDNLHIVMLNGQLHIYDFDKCYYSMDLKFLRNCMRAMMPNIKKRQIEEVIFHLTDTVDEVKESSPDLVLVKNGILNVKTRKLIAFNPKFIITQRLPVTYDETIKIKRIDEVFLDLAEGNGAEGVRMFCEILGQAIYRDVLVSKAVLLSGQAGAGKSIFIFMCQALLNEDDYTNISIHQLSRDFNVSRLEGKVANFMADIGKQKIDDSATLKALITSDGINTEAKNKDARDFVSKATHIFACNDNPKFSDDSDGIWDRFHIVPFKIKVRGTKKEDGTLKDNIQHNEQWKSYLLNLALDGLESLENNKTSKGKYNYTEPLSVKEAKLSYQRENNNVKLYLFENEIDYEVTGLNKQGIYEHYEQWCLDNRFKKTEILTPTKFTRTAKELGYDLKEKGRHPNKIQYWIKLSQ